MIVSKCNEAERASRLLVVSVALAISSAATAQEAETPANAVQSDVRQIVHALYSGDIETVPSFTHPSIIQRLGGPEAARAATQQALDRISQQASLLSRLPELLPQEDVLAESCATNASARRAVYVRRMAGGSSRCSSCRAALTFAGAR